MGKKQHSKGKDYILASEWANEWGGKKSAANAPFRRLPFNCCALAFTCVGTVEPRPLWHHQGPTLRALSPCLQLALTSPCPPSLPPFPSLLPCSQPF